MDINFDKVTTKERHKKKGKKIDVETIYSGNVIITFEDSEGKLFELPMDYNELPYGLKDGTYVNVTYNLNAEIIYSISIDKTAKFEAIRNGTNVE